MTGSPALRQLSGRVDLYVDTVEVWGSSPHVPTIYLLNPRAGHRQFLDDLSVLVNIRQQNLAKFFDCRPLLGRNWEGVKLQRG
jgi:hypothetical protein